MAFAREKILLQFKNTNIQTTKYFFLNTMYIPVHIYTYTAYILGFRCLNHRMHNVKKKTIRFPTTQQNIIYRYSTYL